jgi:hypothetical protein
MKNFEQVKDVIEYSQAIHERLRKIYVAVNVTERPEKEKMLLGYLIDKQVQSEALLANFEVIGQSSMLDNWMQFTPKVDLHELFAEQPLTVEMAFNQIMQFADVYSLALVDFYTTAANESELPKVRQIFESLANMAIQGNRQQDHAALFNAM